MHVMTKLRRCLGLLNESVIGYACRAVGNFRFEAIERRCAGASRKRGQRGLLQHGTNGGVALGLAAIAPVDVESLPNNAGYLLAWVQAAHGVLEDHLHVALPASRPTAAFMETDLPEPNSPTMATVSPLRSSTFTPRIACTTPALVLKEMPRSLS